MTQLSNAIDRSLEREFGGQVLRPADAEYEQPDGWAGGPYLGEPLAPHSSKHLTEPLPKEHVMLTKETPTPTITWEAPGKGSWELETTHAVRGTSGFLADGFGEGFARGFRHGTARYGLLLSHFQPRLSNGFIYMQAVPFGVPPGSGPPPAPLLWLLLRLNPKIRARLKECRQAFAERRWRSDLEEWDNVDKPAAIHQHRQVLAVDVAALSDAELATHIGELRGYLEDSHFLHHKYSVPAILVVGDFLAAAVPWTGLPSGQLLGLLRGNSKISHGFAADELGAAAAAIAAGASAGALLEAPGEPADVLSALSRDPSAGPAVTAYLDAVRYRCVGYDVGDKNAGEMPRMLLGTLRSAVAGAAAAPYDGVAEAAIRARVPEEHRAEFDARLAEARLLSRLRDERDAYSDGWATGLTRRALLEAGRRLVAAGKLGDAEHAVDLTAAEVAALLVGDDGPSASEVAARFEFRTTHTTDDAPPTLGGTPGPPTDPSLIPPAGRRGALAMGAAMNGMFGVSETPNTDAVITGLAVNSGVYEGTARVIHDASELGRIQRGDVLVARMTTPYFNIVLPMLGALVTDRGGQLSHPAIVAREFGIPGIVGTREATAKIADGARVRVDGTTGEVHLLT